MTKQAWITAWSSKQGNCADVGACDLDQALSLLAELDKRNRMSCPTLLQLRAEDDKGIEVQGCDRVALNLYFGRRAQASKNRSDCSIGAELLKPSGYYIILNVPRFVFGIMRRPDSFSQYEAKGTAVSREQLVTVIRTCFECPDKTLRQWAEKQPYLTPVGKDNDQNNAPQSSATQDIRHSVGSRMNVKTTFRGTRNFRAVGRLTIVTWPFGRLKILPEGLTFGGLFVPKSAISELRWIKKPACVIVIAKVNGDQTWNLFRAVFNGDRLHDALLSAGYAVSSEHEKYLHEMIHQDCQRLGIMEHFPTICD